MLKRSFTTREKTLLLILAVLALAVLYYYAVFAPCQERVLQANSRLLDAEAEIMSEQVRLATYNSMETVIAEYEAGGSSRLLPDYNNQQNVMKELNSLLEQADSYTLSFGEITFAENTAARPVTMSYSCQTYDEACQIARRLEECIYTCSIGPLAFSAQDENWDVRLTVTFYESAIDLEPPSEEAPAQ